MNLDKIQFPEDTKDFAFKVGSSDQEVEKIEIVVGGKSITLDKSKMNEAQIEHVQSILGRIQEKNEVPPLQNRTIRINESLIQIVGDEENLAVTRADKESAYELSIHAHNWTKSPTTLPFLARLASAVSGLFFKQKTEEQEPDTKLTAKPNAKAPVKMPTEPITQEFYTDDGRLIGTETAIPDPNCNTSFELRQKIKEKGWENDYDFNRLTNYWNQGIERPNGEKVANCGRMGVITDLRHGFYSLKWLKELSKNEENPLEQLNAKIQEIKDFRNNLEDPTPNQAASLERQIEKLEKLRDAYGSEFDAKLDEVIKDRREILESQMIQYVEKQVEHNPNTETDEFHLYQISLLNLNKRKMDKNGIMFNEKVEYEDMYEIFKEFDGVELPNGKILRPHIINISVQGNKDTKHQVAMNKDQIDAFDLDEETKRKLTTEYKPTVTESVLGALGLGFLARFGHSGYGDAIQVTDEVMDHLRENKNGAVGIICLSGKDRTGAVVGLVLDRQRKKTAEGMGDSTFKDEVIGPDSIAAKIVAANTPKIRLLKVIWSDSLTEEAELSPVKKLAYLASQAVATLFNKS